jgi:hypothetical protein
MRWILPLALLAMTHAADLALSASALQPAPAAWGPGWALSAQPGTEVAVAAPAAGWASVGWLWFDAQVDGDRIGTVEVRIYERGAGGIAQDQTRRQGGGAPAVTMTLGLFPGLRTRLAVPWSALDGQSVFLDRTPGRLKGFCAGRRVDPAAIERVTIALRDAGAAQVLLLSSAQATAERPDFPVPTTPVVDALGQRLGHDWPGRTRDEPELRRILTGELTRLRGAAFPADRSRWGGDATRTWNATGRFRTEQREGRWWLVDPDGHPFFSAGLDCVNAGEPTVLLPGMDALVAGLPPRDGDFADCWTTHRRGTVQCNLAQANVVRSFGPGWRRDWTDLTAGRLRSWGFNTVGNWSDLEFARASGLPWVLPMNGFPTTVVQLFRDFPDVFADEFSTKATAWAAQLGAYRDDAALIGYFLRNEPLWAFGDFNLASEMLEANPGTATRRELLAFLRTRHADEAAWQRAWNCPQRTFADIEHGLWRRAAEATPAAAADLAAFTLRMAEAYVGIPSRAAKAVDPGHLNLGMRFAWIAGPACLAGAQHYDVFTINCYRDRPAADELARIVAAADRPILIGEWHFGAVDRGVPASGLKAVATQADRGAAYRRYFDACAADPRIVGCHWFTLNDQAVLGRFDGENFQIGFVDGCHRPYPELVEAAAASHQAMYEVAQGRAAPFAGPVADRPTVGF